MKNTIKLLFILIEMIIITALFMFGLGFMATDIWYVGLAMVLISCGIGKLADHFGHFQFGTIYSRALKIYR